MNLRLPEQMARLSRRAAGVFEQLRVSTNTLRRMGLVLILPAVAVAAASALSPIIDGTIDPTTMTREVGLAFTAPVAPRTPFPYVVRGASVGQTASGPMTLFEADAPLRREDAHDVIRKMGRGTYSHWANTLYFSSSDGSDPRTNRRSYRYRVQSAVRRGVVFLPALSAGLGLVLLGFAARATPSREPRPILRGTVRVGVGAGVVGAAIVVSAEFAPWMMKSMKTAVRVDSARAFGRLGHLVRLDESATRFFVPANDLTQRLLPHAPMMLEDGREIGRVVANPYDVANGGEGRFTLNDGLLAFSTSDGSDPRSNGRTYALVRPREAHRGVVFGGLALFVVGICVGAARLFVGSKDALTFGATWRSPRTLAIAFASVVLVPVLMLLAMWVDGASGYLGVAGYMPVSDAMGYYRCAVGILGVDTLNGAGIGGDWCSRRVLYPAALASLLAASDWHTSLVLLAQSALIGGASALLFSVLARVLGWVVAVLTIAAVLAFAQEFAIGNFMTEALGLPAGLTGLALLLLWTLRPARGWLLVLGLALIGFGMAVRAGAVFVLPLLGLWAVVATFGYRYWHQRLRLWTACAIALTSGIALQFLVVYAMGFRPTNTGGNFAMSLYGLSTGSRDWSEAYRKFADVFRAQPESAAFAYVRQAAIENIRTQPKVFLGALRAALSSYLEAMFNFGPLDRMSPFITIAFLAGLPVCFVFWRNAALSLLGVFAIGELVSAPLVFDSGGNRIFAVTFAARAAVAACAAAFAITIVARGTMAVRSAAGEPAPVNGLTSVAAALGAGFFLLALAPLSPLVGSERLAQLHGPGNCGVGEWEMVTELDRGSFRMTFGERRNPVLDETLGVAAGRLELDPVTKGAWWMGKLPTVPNGTELAYFVQRASPNLGLLVPTFSRKPLAIEHGPVSLCLVREPTQRIGLGDFEFDEIVSVTPLGPGAAQQQPSPNPTFR
jgi:hypothetical protein